MEVLERLKVQCKRAIFSTVYVAAGMFNVVADIGFIEGKRGSETISYTL